MILKLWFEGKSQSEIGRLLGIPRRTCSDIIRRNGVYKERCKVQFDISSLDKANYAFILGEYLGDGHVSKMNRTYRIRIFQDNKYPKVIQEIENSLEILFGKSNKLSGNGCTIIYAYSNSVPQYFPQHGKGLKKDRKIVLEDWQDEIINQYPLEFLRGLIWSDGCIFFNKALGYSQIDFCNSSEDIKDLFCRVLDLIGIRYIRYPNYKSVRVSFKQDGILLIEAIGEKS